MTNIKVSIIVPCYNQADYLNEALQSVLKQTETNWECIIVNDGSTDNSETIAKRWVEKDQRFKYLQQKNSGLCHARNFGIENALGEFVLPLDADDKLGIDYLKLGLEAFNNNGKLKVVYCYAEKFDEDSGLWKLAEFNLFNLSRKNMIFCSAMFRKKDWELVGGYDINMIYGWEDWEFWISLLKKGGEVERIESVQFYYRIKKGSMLREMDFEKSKKMAEYVSVKHADFFVKYYGSFLELEQAKEQVIGKYEEKLKSEKFIINAFTKRFFGFIFFRNMKEVNEFNK
ncbi:glycosyltransferase family 2 protein [Mariniflexile sp. HMF6888]|uniref:glycosyltransferase family 2 protein n=1 Tax=Mariniflexile sp. HMF6888 TaxID=3373086 RepID=UPI0037952FDC